MRQPRTPRAASVREPVRAVAHGVQRHRPARHLHDEARRVDVDAGDHGLHLRVAHRHGADGRGRVL
eukprot:CAMPEP_0176300382 /NCGR_PEP_ID=MMETSP0121_2-20121125/60293_1 /TAXON_ID=160619 /ORGANISM="Kryptoperidinium foliaceum, Strain CCMP 1326" /LENGTH=65 /DNA_ID=CAMNT_0017641769 /DNA_START=36 /DNA_END=229 /DNA_ORIENTATION=+